MLFLIQKGSIGFIKRNCEKINYLKACIKFHMVSEKDATLLRNVFDILGVKVVVAAVVLFHFCC